MSTNPTGYGVSTVREICVADSRHPEIRRLRRLGYQPSLHGTKVWRSCYAMMEYLEQNPIDMGAQVMDVGCGWGVLSAYFAVRFKAQVLAVDADADLEYFVALHAEMNDVELDFVAARFQQLRRADFTGIDLLVGTDICFWEELTQPILLMIGRAIDAGVPRIVIGDPGRQPFWQLSQKCAKRFGAQTITQKTLHPVRTEKQLLIIEGR
ncbi:MAG: putative nicotinamide N-methyase [Halieaceae bacterium]